MKSTLAFTQMLMLSTSLLCLSSYATQKSTVTPSGENKNAQKVKSSCKTADNPHRFEIKHIESKGIGYNQGYTSLDAFFTGNYCNFIPFIDLRAHVFNNGKWASNAGIGTRYVMDPCKSMVGVNAYYDYRSTKHFHYNQVGAGIEAYYDRFEFLANGYLPLGRKRMRTRHELESIDFKRFSGNSILYNKYYKNRYEGAMKGFNAEVGTHFAGDMKEFDLYFGIGPYYYDLHKDKSTWGGKARLKMELSRFLFVELSDSWDHIFHNRFQVSANVSVPFGVKKCYGKKRMPNGTTQNCSNIMDWLATLPVDRQEIIVVDKFKKKQTIDPVAIDPATGQPFYVVFVNNANSDVGVGTYEDPVTCLSLADAVQTAISPTPPSAYSQSSAGNIIYVFPGDGTNARMSTGMVLKQGQRMLGSGIAHTVNTTDGVLYIPAQTPQTPFITGTTAVSPAVLIDVDLSSLPANNCEVSGFRIAMQTVFPAGNQAFAGSNIGCIAAARTTNISNVKITQNSIVNEQYGILLGNDATPFYIEGDVIVDNNVIAMHGAGGTLGRGIYVPVTRNVNMFISNNSIEFLPVLNALTSNGIDVVMTDQTQVSILSNHINGISNNGIRAVFQNAATPAATLTATCIVEGNTITNVGAAGLLANSLNAATTPGSIKLIAENNSVVNQGVTSGVTTGAIGSMLLRFNNNTIPTLLLTTNAAATSLLYVEPPLNNTTIFTIAGGGNPIIPITPCQYGGPGCP